MTIVVSFPFGWDVVYSQAALDRNAFVLVQVDATVSIVDSVPAGVFDFGSRPSRFNEIFPEREFIAWQPARGLALRPNPETWTFVHSYLDR